MFAKFMSFWPILACCAAIGYLAVGAAILDKAMAFIHRNSGADEQFRRMAIEDGQRASAMRLAQLVMLAGWPLAVAAIVIQNGRRQTPGFAAP